MNRKEYTARYGCACCRNFDKTTQKRILKRGDRQKFRNFVRQYLDK